MVALMAVVVVPVVVAVAVVAAVGRPVAFTTGGFCCGFFVVLDAF